MNTIVGWLGMVLIGLGALAVLLAPLDDVLVSFHWTIPLAMTVVGLILLVIDLTLNRDV